MSEKLYLYPLWVRIWHIFNAILFIILIVTGISLQFSGVRDPLNALVSFKPAVGWHNTCAFLLTVSYVVYYILNFTSGNFRHYRSNSPTPFKDMITQFNYYSRGMFRGEPHPFPVKADSKFNPLQRFTYRLAMYGGMPLLIISGTLLFFPEVLPRQFLGVSGLLIADIIHISTGFLLSIFMFVHIYTCTLGSKPTTIFKNIIDGYYHDEH